MIALSSNACTEFLQTLFTIEAISKTTQDLELNISQLIISVQFN